MSLAIHVASEIMGSRGDFLRDEPFSFPTTEIEGLKNIGYSLLGMPLGITAILLAPKKNSSYNLLGRSVLLLMNGSSKMIRVLLVTFALSSIYLYIIIYI